MDKINVFGTEYIINFKTEKDHPKFEAADANGLCESYTNNIYIRIGYEKDDTAHDNIAEYKRKILRHELFHAIFHELGQRDYEQDERLVDMLAIVYPKIEKIMEQVKTIDVGENNT